MVLAITEAQIDLVKSSFNKILPIADQAAVLFYNRLFEIAPETRVLFEGTDMVDQRIKLMQMIWQAIGLLSIPEKLIPALQGLGQRHRAYGVTAEHYDVVGTALIWTLEQGLGEAFTPATREAWATVYTIMADTAKAAAYA